jgi:Zn-dependent M28 family amino/carboxypeptidase
VMRLGLCVGAVLGVVFPLAACAGGDGGSGAGRASEEALAPALASIDADDLLRHTTVLASDAFEGRGPGTAGEDSTVAWLEARFRELGLEPGNPDGTYIQDVPLVGIRTTGEARLRAGGQNIALEFPRNYVAVSRHVTPQIDVTDSDLVFVGYGVVAPEYGWDDYKGADLTGKTLVMLINDPAIPDPADSTRLNDSMFNGDAMTYYGRWTYKYEIASELGAAAAIIVHETGPAGYPWAVVSGSWGGENFDISAADGNRSRVPVEAWINVEKARELFTAAGQDFDALKRQALGTDFEPVPLNATASFRLRNQTREVASRNVIAMLPGSDPERRDEYVVYTAHWDHLGRDDRLPEGVDNIFNGALDNATGTAALIELAQAFTQLAEAPPRSVLFLAVTAEEQGLLGAKYYGENPLYPHASTLANINIDGVNQWGRTSDVVIVGYGNSTLDDLLAEEAAATGRTIVPDPEPEKGFFYRSDHFEFAKQGVPALYIDAGVQYIGKPEGYGEQKREEYTTQDYHKPSDHVKPDWDLSGAVEDLQLLFRVGHRVAGTDTWPEWKPGTEFKARREAMLATRRD